MQNFLRPHPVGTAIHDHAEIATSAGSGRAQGLTDAWGGLSAIVHHEISIVGTPEHLVHETNAHSTSLDGTTTTAQQTVWIDRNADGAINSARIYS